MVREKERERKREGEIERAALAKGKDKVSGLHVGRGKGKEKALGHLDDQLSEQKPEGTGSTHKRWTGPHDRPPSKKVTWADEAGVALTHTTYLNSEAVQSAAGSSFPPIYRFADKPHPTSKPTAEAFS